MRLKKVAEKGFQSPILILLPHQCPYHWANWAFPSLPTLSLEHTKKENIFSSLLCAQNIWGQPSPFWHRYVVYTPSRTLINVSWPPVEPKGPIEKLGFSILGLFCCSLQKEAWFCFSQQPHLGFSVSGCCLAHWAPRFLQRSCLHYMHSHHPAFAPRIHSALSNCQQLENS